MVVKALLFDFNGVIIDDERIQMRVYQQIFAEKGIVMSDEEYMSSLGMDDRTLVRETYKRAGREIDQNEVLAITELKSKRWRGEIADDLPVFPGVENFIRKAANEMSLGIVSMSRLNDILYVLERTGLTNLFKIIISADEVPLPKPDPTCYREGFRQLDLARIDEGHLPMVHSECVVIEDSPPGVMAARAADLPVLGVPNTVPSEELRKAGAMWIAKNLNDWWPESIRRAFM